MASFLLYSKNTAKTGKLLARILQIPHGQKAPATQQEVLIRWGSSAPVARRPRRVMNTKNGILKVTNKLQALEQLRAAHIPAPRTAQLSEGTLEMLKFPVLARKVNHQEGRDIVLCMQVADAERARRAGSQYAVEYIPTRTEYRLHVFGQEILRSSQKVLAPNVDPNVLKPWVRNHSSGYIFVSPRQEPGPLAVMAAIDSVQNASLTFGAVDIIIGDDGRPYVLEINTGPGLVESGLRQYAEKFAEILEIEELDEEVFAAVVAELNEGTETENAEEAEEIEE